MSASVDTRGLEKMSKGIRRAVTGQLQTELVRMLQDAGPKIETDIRGGASSKMQRKAAATVQSTKQSAGISLASNGSGLGATIFNGAEYGGRKPKRIPYATRSRAGKPYVVHRRTTMQFLPHLGTEGYFFWPAVRDWMPKLTQAQEPAIAKALGGR